MKENNIQKPAVVGGKFDLEKEYWSKKLPAGFMPTHFPPDFPAGPGTDDRRAVFHFTFPQPVTTDLLRIANHSEYGLFIILVSGVLYLLCRYTGDEDAIILCPRLSGQGPLFLRCPVKGETAFKDFLHQVKTALQEAEGHMNYYAFEEIVKSVNLPGNRQETPVSGVLVRLQNIHVEADRHTLPVDILFDFTLKADSLEAGIDFPGSRFIETKIQALSRHLIQYFRAVTGRPATTLDDIDILSIEEKHRIVNDFNASQADFPRHRTLDQLFNDQVEKGAERIALVCGHEHWTFRHLHIDSSLLAESLVREQGIRPGDIVAFLVNRSLEMVTAILGILKAGAAVLPLETRWPKERIKSILADSGAGILIKSGCIDGPVDARLKVMDIQASRSTASPGAGITASHRSHDPAYIIYTSGSTGVPKGVVLLHTGIVNHVFIKIKELSLTESDLFCHNLNIGFVASIWQVFAPLFLGSRLVVYPEETVMNYYLFFKQVVKDRVTVLEIVPSLLGSYLEWLASGKEKLDFSHLRVLVLTGEAVPPSLVRKFFLAYRLPLVNAYGQSECSDDTLHYAIPNDPEITVVPIGKPAANTRAFILGRGDQIQPIGVPGELFLAGEGLARGYLNNPELTVERFVGVDVPIGMVLSQDVGANNYSPLQDHCSIRLYKTGDLARWLPDGNIEFLGRRDHQVKIRGHRVELGEIEHHLRNHPGVKEAVALWFNTGEPYLCAYFVPASPDASPVSALELTDYLTRLVPDYMVPRSFVPLEKIPLTPNGKVDRRSLPCPGQTGTEDPQSPAPDHIQSELIDVFARVLRLDKEKIGIDTHFFRSGGHSLKGVILLSEIQQKLNVKVSLLEIFENPTIRLLAEHIRRSRKEPYTAIVPAEPKPFYLLSSAQKRLYILQQMDLSSMGYNLPMVVELTGEIDRQKLSGAFQQLIDRHESLRTSFEMIDGEPRQRIHERVDLELRFYPQARDKADETRMIDDFFKPFDLTCAPLLRAALIQKDGGSHLLALDVHHIVADGASLSILIKDLTQGYAGETLPPLRLQYRDFSEWQNNLIKSGAMAEQEEYWLGEFAGDIPVLKLPTDYERPAVKTFAGDSLDFSLSPEIGLKARTLAQDTDTTLFMVLLAAYYILLFKYTLQEEIVVGSPILGRRHPDLEPIVGMFVNMLPIKAGPTGSLSFLEFLAEVKKKVLNAMENQDVQFEDLVARLGLQGVSDRNPLFDAVFTLNEIEVKAAGLPQLQIKPHGYENKIARFDILMGGHPAGNGAIYLFIEYSTSLLKSSTAKALARHYGEIVDQVLENRSIGLGDIRLSSDLAPLKTNEFSRDQADFGF